MIQVTIQNQPPEKKIYVRLKFNTLNSWSYEYSLEGDLTYGSNSQTNPTFHLLGTKAELFDTYSAYDIRLDNSTDISQPYTISVEWFIEKVSVLTPEYSSFDDEELFTRLELKNHTDTIEPNEYELENENIHFN